MKRLKKLTETAGWIGVALVILAYFLVSFEIIEPKNILYSVMNLFGAIFIIGSSLDNRDWQPIVLNAIWALIALAGIVGALS